MRLLYNHGNAEYDNRTSTHTQTLSTRSTESVYYLGVGFGVWDDSAQRNTETGTGRSGRYLHGSKGESIRGDERAERSGGIVRHRYVVETEQCWYWLFSTFLSFPFISDLISLFEEDNLVCSYLLFFLQKTSWTSLLSLFSFFFLLLFINLLLLGYLFNLQISSNPYFNQSPVFSRLVYPKTKTALRENLFPVYHLL